MVPQQSGAEGIILRETARGIRKTEAKKRRNDMKDTSIVGSGSLPGGDQYGKISVSGSGRLLGSIRCEALSSAGSCHAERDVECAGKLSAAGSFRADGDVRAGIFSVSGSAAVGGRIRAGTLKLAGSLHAKDSVEAAVLTGSGTLRTEGGAAVQTVTFSGALHVGGPLRAEKLEWHVGGDSEVHDIGGTEIRILTREAGTSRTGGVLAAISDLFGVRLGRVKADTVEGDKLELDALDAKVVRGREIFVHAGCRIDRVEYAETLDVEEGAVIGEQIPT